MPKFIVYQLLPRLYTNSKLRNIYNGSLEENGCGKFRDYTVKALNAIKEMGVSHVWFTGVIEHATCTDYTAFGIKKDNPSIVKGKAGSAYAIKDYYDVDPDLASDVKNRMKEFEHLVKRTHQVGLKFVMDFVPNHVAREYHSDSKPFGVTDLGENDHSNWHFSPLNNFYYIPDQKLEADFLNGKYDEFPAKATGNDQFSANPGFNDWFETIKLNYGVNYVEGMQKQFDPIPDTWFKMRDILLFWASKGVDAFRCDMAEMVPVEFWHWAIADVKRSHPSLVFIAEVYNPDQYRSYIHHGGFDYLYDKVGMYDTLRSVVCDGLPAYRISNAWQTNDDIQEKMLQFFENHDEQRVASEFFAGEASKAFPAISVLVLLNTSPFMLYMGQELGERGMDEEGYSGRDGRTTIFDYRGIESIQRFVNKGKFDGAGLTDSEKGIRSFYSRICNLAMQIPALREGTMYDLNYANFDNISFDPERQFAWIRKLGNEIFLICANFDGQHKQLGIMIPDEALDFLMIPRESILKRTEISVFETKSDELTENPLFEKLEAEHEFWNTNEKFRMEVPGHFLSIVKLEL